MDEIEMAGRLLSCRVTIANYCVASCEWAFTSSPDQK